jgi:hypothetical protein
MCRKEENAKRRMSSALQSQLEGQFISRFSFLATWSDLEGRTGGRLWVEGRWESDSFNLFRVVTEPVYRRRLDIYGADSGEGGFDGLHTELMEEAKILLQGRTSHPRLGGRDGGDLFVAFAWQFCWNNRDQQQLFHAFSTDILHLDN